MKRSTTLLPVLLAVVAACGASDEGVSGSSMPATMAEPAFPVTVEADNGPVTIEQPPRAIVSLSSTATEVLFAIGAGDQVVAVDDQSNFPPEAPITDLAAFTPNIEAILSYQPDLVLIAYDPGDLVASLEAAGVPVINQEAAANIDDVYAQVQVLGRATGRIDGAAALNRAIEEGLDQALDEAPDVPDGTTYYHELDNLYFTVTSATFFGEIYALFGLGNIADPADEDGSAGGYPQLSSEYIVAADPDLIFLADTLYGESPETVAARPGWDVLTAVGEGHVFPLDSDVASRWGPRIVDFTEAVSDALVDYVDEG